MYKVGDICDGKNQHSKASAVFFVCDFMRGKGIISIIPFPIAFIISFQIEFFSIFIFLFFFMYI